MVNKADSDSDSDQLSLSQGKCLFTTFSRDSAMELGRLSLCDQDVLHGSDEDRSSHTSCGFDHLRDCWTDKKNRTQSMAVSVSFLWFIKTAYKPVANLK